MRPETEDRIAAFAQQLGILPDEDEEFGWLAEVGLQSPLPPRWTSHSDETTGYVYYVDHDRQISSWENPLVPYLRRIVEIGRAYLQSRTEDFFEEQKGLLWHQHKHDLACWHGPFSDAEGRSYYVNSTAGVSSWQDPRVDAQYIFELESGLLTTLAEVLPAPEPDTPGWGEGEPNSPWKTGNGAEVLTLEDSTTPELATTGRPRMAKALTRQLTEAMGEWARKENRDEHKSALEKMTVTAEKLRAAQQDEEEVQRLRFSRKVEERKQRRQRLAKRANARKALQGQDFGAQPLAPLPGQDRCSPNGVLMGRPAPQPLLSERLGGADTPDGGTPADTPGGNTPAETPAATPLGSPAHASPHPPSPLDLNPPPPPPPERGSQAVEPIFEEPTAVAADYGGSRLIGSPSDDNPPIIEEPKGLLARASHHQAIKESRLFSSLAAAAPVRS